MITKIKQLFCEHIYRTVDIDDNYYVSVGDEHHKRKSVFYAFECVFCGKKMGIFKKWDIDKKLEL